MHSNYFDNLTFFTKKGLDFKDWRTVILLKNKRLHLTDSGQILIKSICKRINSYRLTTNLNNKITSSNQDTLSIDKKIEELLATGQIWVYDKGLLVNGSPFNNFKEIVKALGFTKRSKSYIIKFMDTGKQYKYRYTFYSKPFES